MFPSIPASTVRAARALYGRGNVYLRLGDRLNQLISKFDPGIVSSLSHEDKAALFSLLTIIQYVEKLTDSELADAIQHRIDLRYALHLATPNHRLHPHSFCAFRSRIFTDPQYRALLEEMFKHIYPEITPTAMIEESDANTILRSICENEIRSSLIEAMLNAIEALSANHFSWLRGIAQPHWYQRYNHSLVATIPDGSVQKQELRIEDIKEDIQHLLYEIHKSKSRDIMEMHETKTLNRMWEKLSDLQSIRKCNSCIHKIH